MSNMLNALEASSMVDLDEKQCLNGRDSLVIIPIKNKKLSRKIRLKEHLKNYSTRYLIIAVLIITAFVMVNIQKEYHSSLAKASSYNHEIEALLGEPKYLNERKDMSSSQMFIENKKDKGEHQLKRQSVEAKQPSRNFYQFNKDNRKQVLKSIYQEVSPQAIKYQPQPKLQTAFQKSSNYPQESKKISNNPSEQNRPTIQTKMPNQPPIQQTKYPQAPSANQSPFQPANQLALHQKSNQATTQKVKQGQQPRLPPPSRGANTRAIAGISQEQRINAQKWLALKDQNVLQSSALADEERQYYQEKYNINSFDQLPICIVIPSFNNIKENRHLKNIKSVIMQEYTNYHIVFIDDASTDGTGDQIIQFLEKQTKLPKEKYIIIKNLEQKRAMPNLRMAANQYCQPQDIFIIVDGDDQLLGRQVLKLYNAVFQTQKAWFVYSNFLTIRGSVGYSRPFPQSTITSNKYRGYPFVTSHLRAFYTQLFRNINESDLRGEDGNYLKAANDVAICIPILQMSHQRVFYFPQLTYYYNSNTGQNNHQLRLKQQKSNDKMIRKRKSYQRISELTFSPKLSSKNKNEVPPQQYPPNLQIEKNAVSLQGFKTSQ